MHQAKSARITVRFTGDFRFVGPKFRSFFISPFRHLEFGGVDIGKFENPKENIIVLSHILCIM
jgi:hypothetical protein